MHGCCDCKKITDTRWRMTDEGGDARTAIRCCDDCAAIRTNRGEHITNIDGDFDSAMRGIVNNLSH